MDAFVTKLPRPQRKNDSRLSQSTRAPDAERPTKRVKRNELEAPDSIISDDSSLEGDKNTVESTEPDVHDSEEDEQDDARHHVTEFESALAPTHITKEAIEEYETLRSSQLSLEESGEKAKTQSLWIKGRSSIYVDAFNLALDTVLDEESHLFDQKELAVFQEWRDLTYEAQYL